MPDALIRRVDCVRLPVADLDDGLAFYRDALGHRLVWRSDTAAGLSMRDDNAPEIVIHTEGHPPETDLLVDDAGGTAKRCVDAGGRIVAGPFDIQVGRCVVVVDPFGNTLVLLDMSKGRLISDGTGRITGAQPQAPKD